MRRLTHIIVLAAFVFSCGGQWYALQCVAWVNMLHDYAQLVPLSEAVSMTFSGQYPCEICKVIAEKKSSEQQKSLAFGKYQKEFLPPIAIAILPPSDSPFQYRTRVTFFQSRTETPPTPPPRRVLS
jgi:hypothetical protein